MVNFKQKIKPGLLVVMLSLLVYPAIAQEMGNHTASWIGNTGNTGGDGVGISGSNVRGRLQNQIGSMAVTSGGVVLAAGEWDEAHIFVGAYQNGALVANFPGLVGWYVDGGAIATNGSTTIITVEEGSLKKYNTSNLSSISVVGSDVVVSTTIIRGLAIVGNELYVSDRAANKIKVYNHTNMTFVREFAFANPGAITYDGTFLWIADVVGKQVEKWSASGTYQMQIQLASNVLIDDIAFGNSKIYVADMGVDNNVKIFNTSGTSAGTMGTSLFSGTRGAYAPGKFAYLSGIDLDAGGNIYISTDFQQSPYPFNTEKPRGGYTNIESYTSAGTTLNWSMYDWAFIEVAVPDPDNENILYDGRHYYEMDYTKPVGQEVVAKGVTWDPNLYPDDRRSKDDLYTVLDMKKAGGIKYLFCTGMYGGTIDVYKFKGGTDGKIASPAGSVNSGLDGDWGLCVDNAGNIWFAGYTGGIKKYTYNGLDGSGNPTWTNATTIAMPAPFTGIRRLEYDSDKDEMYIWGYTADFPNTRDTWGKGAGRRMAKYNNWSTGNRTAAWVNGDFIYYKDPNAQHGDAFIASTDIAGDYIFCQYSHQLWLANGGNTPNAQYLEVYRKSDGSKVGYMQPSPEADLGWAQIDIPFGMRANKRANGEYNIFVEDDWFHKIVMYKWNPTGTGTTNSYIRFEAESATESAPLAEGNDANASGGKFVSNPSGAINNTAVARATYTFNVTVAGTYKIWGRAITPAAGDSYWVKVDGGNWIKWNGIAGSTATTWTWDDVHNTDNAGQVMNYSLSAGSHTLQISEREAGTRLDKWLITNDMGYTPSGLEGGPTYLWIETESASELSPLVEGSDANASGGKYVWNPSGAVNNTAVARATYTFTVTEAGNYKVWGRAITPAAGDSYWVKMDGGNWIKWNGIAGGTAISWTWDEVHNTDNSAQVMTYTLSAGTHTLQLSEREAGCRLDRWLITNDLGYTPAGSTAASTARSEPEFAAGNDFADADVKVFPNPAGNELSVSLYAVEAGEARLVLSSMEGRSVKTLSRRLAKGLNNLSINTADIKSGNYLLNIQAAGKKSVRKVVIAR